MANVNVIFDTDMDSDCDDAGALAVLHALADRGEIRILATMVSSQNEWSAPCVQAINTYYGRPEIPIGSPKGRGASKPSKYAQRIAEEFPQSIGSNANAEDAARLYRRILLDQPDHSVTIITVGYLTNLADLLKLPAEGTIPSGRDVVRQKVLQWACMGGNFVGRPAHDDLALSNNNFTVDAASAYDAVRQWPVKVMFVGREIGSVPSGLRVGANLRTLPERNPVRKAYEYYFGGEAKDRHVADQTTVVYAVRGLRDYWNAETEGYMDLQPDMTFTWRYDGSGPECKQGYLLKRTVDGKPNDRAIEAMIDELMLQPPRESKRITAEG